MRGRFTMTRRNKSGWRPLGVPESELGDYTPLFITTVANRTLEPIHNRMPVILGEVGAADWMNTLEPDRYHSSAFRCRRRTIFYRRGRPRRW